MGIEKTVDNSYRIFKLKEDDLNWTYVANGPVWQAQSIHSPVIWRGIEEMPFFTDGLINNHMKYLEEKGCHPLNSHCSHISFSYEPPCESALVYNEIRHTEKLSKEEIRQFEKCLLYSHKEYWNRHQPPKTA